MTYKYKPQVVDRDPVTNMNQQVLHIKEWVQTPSGAFTRWGRRARVLLFLLAPSPLPHINMPAKVQRVQHHNGRELTER